MAASEGQILCYGGQAVFAAFHSSSAGFTEDCGAIWSELPYLKSVFSPEGPDSVPNYVTRVERSPLDFRDTLLSLRPEADFSGPVETWLGPSETDALIFYPSSPCARRPSRSRLRTGSSSSP